MTKPSEQVDGFFFALRFFHVLVDLWSDEIERPIGSDQLSNRGTKWGTKWSPICALS